VLRVGHFSHQAAHLPGSQVHRQTFVLRARIQVFDVELSVEHGKIKLIYWGHDQTLIRGSDAMFFNFPEQVFLDLRFRYLQWVIIFFLGQLQETPHCALVVLNGVGTVSLYDHFPFKFAQQIRCFHRPWFYVTFVYAKI